MNSIYDKRTKAFKKAEASLYLSNKDPRGLPYYELIKSKVINGELTYEEARLEVLNYYTGKSK